jgi:transcription elongation factor Elf1
MNETIKNYREECIILRSQTEENDKRIRELLKNPMVSEFFKLYFDNIKIKEKLSAKEQKITYLEMCECQHAFIITGVEKDFENGRVNKTPIYHCVKCGLTNYYDVTNTNDLVDGTKSQMGFIFADTFRNGILLSNEVIPLAEAIDVYNKLIGNKSYTTKQVGSRCWIITESGCVITCPNCGERLELCYLDGTEVRYLPHCPWCGKKLKRGNNI